MQTSLFDLENRYASLSAAGDPLERLDAVIDWEIFRPILERIDLKERKSAEGHRRPLHEERRPEPLRLQEPHQHRPRHQAHHGARLYACPPPRQPDA